MKDQAESTGGGFTVPDGAALVAGAAVASVHVRGVLLAEVAGPGWALVWGTFAWVALTAAGPFVFVLRKYARRLPGYPRIGDRLWALLGLPWLLSALIPTRPVEADWPFHDLLALTLSIGLAAVCLVAIAVVWATWVMVSPERATDTFSGPWTNRVGLILSIAWPIQCGLGMVVIG